MLFFNFLFISMISFSVFSFADFNFEMSSSKIIMLSSKSLPFLPVKNFFRRFSVLIIQIALIRIAIPPKIKKITSSFIFILFQYILFLCLNQEIALILKARPEEIIFTSGGTESNNLAIQGVVFSTWELGSQDGAELPKIPHIITTNIEHPSVLETFKMLQKKKLAEISIVPVEKNGIIDVKKIKKEIKGNTILVSVMYANNEIGTVQPIQEIAKEIRHFKKQSGKLKGFFRSSDPRVPILARPFKNLSVFPLLHTDAVQAVNHLDLNVEKLGVDLLSLSGSKIEGAGRVGILYKKKSVPLTPLFAGGDQEEGLRPGTENLPEIVKFSKALQLAQKIKEKEVNRLTKLRNYFINKIVKNSQIIL